MADNAAIRRELMENTGWRKQGVTNRLAKMSKYLPRDYALYVLAARNDVRIEKHGVDGETVVKTGQLLGDYDDSGNRVVSPSSAAVATSKPTAIPDKKLVVKRSGLGLPVPAFTKGLGGAADARSIDAYSVVYILENAVRELVRRVLQSKYDESWWDRGVTQGIKDHAAGLMEQDSSHPWLGGRGDDPLFYIGFTEYRKIITSKNWKLFEPILGRKTLVEETFTTANLVRRAVAHTAPVTKDDYDGLVVDARRILGQIRGREDQIPS